MMLLAGLQSSSLGRFLDVLSSHLCVENLEVKVIKAQIQTNFAQKYYK